MVVAEPIWQFPDKVYRYLKPVLMIWGRLYRALDLGSPYLYNPVWAGCSEIRLHGDGWTTGCCFADECCLLSIPCWLERLNIRLPFFHKRHGSLHFETTNLSVAFSVASCLNFVAYMCILYTEYISLQSHLAEKTLHGHHPRTVPWATAPPGEEVVLFDHQTFSPLMVKMLHQSSAQCAQIWPRNLLEFLKMKHESIHKNPTFFARFWAMILQ